MSVHPGTGRMLMDLHEKLADHFPAQSLAHSRDLARRFGGTTLAGQSRIQTNIWVIVFGCHGRTDYALNLTPGKGF